MGSCGWIPPRVRIATGSAQDALKFLERDGHLASDAARGPDAVRRIVDPDALLDAYAAGIDWAATSALSASVLAPFQTEIMPMEVYVPARGWSDLRRAAAVAGLKEIDGGRLLLRPYPTPASSTLTDQYPSGFRTMLWPRVYADLRTTGVRGEDAAEHLREEMGKRSA